MLMQYLDPEKRKGEHKYKHGDFILYDDRPSVDEQQQLIEDALKKDFDLKKCPVCGCFMKWWDRRTYCSQRCINDAYMERRRCRHEAQLEKTCVICGQRYTAKRKDAQYCSQACKQAAYRKRNVSVNRSSEIGGTDSNNVQRQMVR